MANKFIIIVHGINSLSAARPLKQPGKSCPLLTEEEALERSAHLEGMNQKYSIYSAAQAKIQVKREIV